MLSWLSEFQYRANTFIVLLLIFLRLTAEIFFWNVYFKASGRNSISGYSFKAMITYYLFMGMFANTLAQSSISGIVSDEIKNGFISKYIVMPINVSGHYFMKDLARKTYEAFIGLAALIPVIVIFRSSLTIAAGLHTVPVLLVAIALSILLSFLIFYNISLLTFWFTEVNSLNMEIVLYICGVAAGVFLLYCFYFTAGCIVFWLIKADFLDNIYSLAYFHALKPVNIYPRILRIVLYSILPLGLIFYTPAEAVRNNKLSGYGRFPPG